MCFGIFRLILQELYTLETGQQAAEQFGGLPLPGILLSGTWHQQRNECDEGKRRAGPHVA